MPLSHTQTVHDFESSQAYKDAGRRLKSGEFTDWFDLVRHAEGRLHGRLNRAGGVAELPNVTADFVCDASDERRTVVIQLATVKFALFQGFYKNFSSRYELVVYILAILELSRWGKLKIFQQELNGPIWVYTSDFDERLLPVEGGVDNLGSTLPNLDRTEHEVTE